MNNITIGQYVPGNSWIYKVDPRLKIVLAIFWIVLLFILPLNIYAMLGFFAVVLLVIITTRIPLLKMLNGLKPVIFISIFTFVLQLALIEPVPNSILLKEFNFTIGLYPTLVIIGLVLIGLLFSKKVYSKMLWWIIILLLCFVVQSNELVQRLNIMPYLNNLKWNTYKLNIYDTNLLRATSIVIRIILMISITSLLTFTTRYQEINQGFTSLLSPLRIFKVPVGTFSMMLSLSLRFIPTLVQETNKIIKAQASRGVDFTEANFKQKINQIISLLVPLFIVSFKKADDLANAMEARGYIMEGKRTNVDKLSFKAIDLVASIFTLCVLAGVIVAKIYL